jgi:hypothetical protein
VNFFDPDHGVAINDSGSGSSGGNGSLGETVAVATLEPLPVHFPALTDATVAVMGRINDSSFSGYAIYVDNMAEESTTQPTFSTVTDADVLAKEKVTLKGADKAAWGAVESTLLSTKSVAAVLAADGNGAAVQAVTLFITGNVEFFNFAYPELIEAATEWLINAIALAPYEPAVSKLVRQLLAVDAYTLGLEHMGQWDRLVAGAHELLAKIGKGMLQTLYAQESLGDQLSDNTLQQYICCSLHVPEVGGVKPSQALAIPAVVAFLASTNDFEDYAALPERRCLMPVLVLACLLQPHFESAIGSRFESSGWCKASVAPVKGASRCLVKMYADYLNLPSPRSQWLLDLLRCLLTAPNVPGIAYIIETISKQFDGFVQLKNPFGLPEAKRADRNHLLLLNGTVIFDSGLTIGGLANGPAAEMVFAELMGAWQTSGEPLCRWRSMVQYGFDVLRAPKLATVPGKMCAEIQLALDAVAEARGLMHYPYDITRAGSFTRLHTSFTGTGPVSAEEYKEALGDATSLLNACHLGQAEIVKTLLENGEDVNQTHPNADGFGGLYSAAQRNHPDVVGILLQAGANVNMAHLASGATPLHMAVVHGHIEVVKMLLAAGANTNTITTEDATPLYVAAKNGYVDVVKALLAAGASKSFPAPLKIAEDRGHADIVALLL